MLPEKGHDCIIGLYNDWDNTRTISFSELLEIIKEGEERFERNKNSPLSFLRTKPFSLKDYFDRRKSTNLELFNFCPVCGKKINHKELLKKEGKYYVKKEK